MSKENKAIEEEKYDKAEEKALKEDAQKVQLPTPESIDAEIEEDTATAEDELEAESIAVIGDKTEEEIDVNDEESQIQEGSLEELEYVNKKNEDTEDTAEEKPAGDDEDDEEFVDDHDEHHEEIDHDNVDEALNEDTEDESAAERHKIPKKDYDSMKKEELIKEFRTLLKNEKIQAIKEHVDEIRASFISKFEEEQDEAKEKFLEEGGNIIDFRYYNPLKKEFNTLYFDYRDKRNSYFQNLKRDLNANLNTRNELIEELKTLKDEVGGEDSINTILEKFRDIQERWRSAGNIPRDRYNLVWNNYHHHVENFYDFLHLNREFRDKDFKENLDKKLKLIEQAEELAQDADPIKSFRELQMLHKIWKEEVGPVAREYREEIWDKFSNATKKVHEARQDYFKNIDAIHEQNLAKKQEVIAKIEAVGDAGAKNHSGWQAKIKEVEALRDEFFKLGKVPRKDNEPTWKAFKNATRNFNRKKNGFYKDQKKEQYDNLKKKMELIQIAEDNMNNEKDEVTTDLMKKIQSDWKKVGHVPRKDSDKIWKRFKKACNHYFDRLHAEKKEVLEEEKDNLVEKQELLDKVNAMKLTGDHAADLKDIKSVIAEWKETGRVPHSKKKIEKEFNQALDGLFKQLDLSKKDAELIKYDNRVAAMADEDDDRQLNKERYFITKKIDEVQAEINQLENNLGFFQHVPDDNPMVAEVHKKIADQKKNLEIWKAKLSKLKSIY